MIRFGMEWQDAPGVRDTVLARTWCRLVIEAGGRLVTQAIDSRSDSLRGGVYGSAFPLGRWIVENWWFLLNESYRFPARYSSRELARVPRDRVWAQRHSLLAAREGGALPDLTLHRDDERKVVARWAPDGGGSDHPSLCFTGEGERRLELADAERGLAEAVEAVLDRLEGFEEPEVGAFREDWAAITGATEQERNLCEWSARLGIDPFDPEDLTDELAEALPELVAGLEAPLRDDLLDAERPQTLHGDIEWLRRAESLAADAGSAGHREFDPSSLPEATPAASNMHVNTAHGLGYACAAAVRRHLSPADGHAPIGDMDEILDVSVGRALLPGRLRGPKARWRRHWSEAATGPRSPSSPTRLASEIDSEIDSSWRVRSSSGTLDEIAPAAGWSPKRIPGSNAHPGHSPPSSWRPRRDCHDASATGSHAMKSTTSRTITTSTRS